MPASLHFSTVYLVLFLSLSTNVLLWSRARNQDAHVGKRSIGLGRNVSLNALASNFMDQESDVFYDSEPAIGRPLVVNRVRQQAQVAAIFTQDDSWTVFEDVSQRDGDLIFENARTNERRIFQKRSESNFYTVDRKIKKYDGLTLNKIGTDPRDLLAESLLKNGEPLEDVVKIVIPPQHSKVVSRRIEEQPRWSNFVGNVEANDNVAIYGYGFTKNYNPLQHFPSLTDFGKRSFDGLLGGWMPAARKVLAGDNVDDFEFYELTIFGDTQDTKNPFQVRTWHRTQHVRNGSIVKTVYGNSFPEYPAGRSPPTANGFYEALYYFGEYWKKQLSDMATLTVPDVSWSHMVRHAFVKELLVRPGGVYPKYGAIDRDYYGSEYDGLQDTLTSSLSANLEWGRFSQAWNVIDNYFIMFVQANGSIASRGPEVGQYGLILSLLAKYTMYSGETDLLWKHKSKIIGMADFLIHLHDESLKLNESMVGFGLIHGWAESDSSLTSKPEVFWKPYFSNSAMAVRGFRDLSGVDVFAEYRKVWTQRADMLTKQTIKTLTNSIFTNKQPPYVPPLPGPTLTFRDSMKKESPSSQEWPHRLYTELLHAAILPSNLTNLVHDTMRSYGATVMGVVANVGEVGNDGRDMLGPISYGYALSLLLTNRLDEFVLFLYTHRYHIHTRGSWTAGEVVDITGGKSIFCIPAQLTIPTIMRWALVLEHPDDDLLLIGRGIPPAWLNTGEIISIRSAPTRFGKVDFDIQFLKGAVTGSPPFPNATSTSSRSKPFLRAQLLLTKSGFRSPSRIEVKLRVPKGIQLKLVTVNGKEVAVQDEALIIEPHGAEVNYNIEAY